MVLRSGTFLFIYSGTLSLLSICLQLVTISQFSSSFLVPTISSHHKVKKFYFVLFYKHLVTLIARITILLVTSKFYIPTFSIFPSSVSISSHSSVDYLMVFKVLLLCFIYSEYYDVLILKTCFYYLFAWLLPAF